MRDGKVEIHQTFTYQGEARANAFRNSKPNSQFQKPTSLRWTQEFCLTDVVVVPKFYTGSDHRLLHARFFFSRKGEKTAKYKERTSHQLGSLYYVSRLLER
ncbi:hypothetical protein Y032_0159g3273 [Ancylostoma ceylanicum]|uniref:Uncharacterized protein n=1 Tax=Ancylostoma ceylanicum TaxID=53326 RepID=A0A016SYD5_9BILA|nr:hypothetical protein Y032_0159g3273 [Ancylostoma ceylanicum]